MVFFRLTMLRRLGYSSNMTPNKTFPTKSSTLLETGDVVFCVEVTTLALQEAWLSVEIRICPESLLNTVRQVHAPLIYTSTCPTIETSLHIFEHLLCKSRVALPWNLGQVFPRTNGSYRKGIIKAHSCENVTEVKKRH